MILSVVLSTHDVEHSFYDTYTIVCPGCRIVRTTAVNIYDGYRMTVNAGRGAKRRLYRTPHSLSLGAQRLNSIYPAV